MPVFYLLLAYLIASVPTGAILAVLYADVDLREHGSGNIGATNAARVVGKTLGVLTLVGDLLKGLLVVLGAYGVSDAVWYPGLVALAAFAGHCWSAYLDFKGGKGVATSAGALLALAPLPTLLVAAGWAGVVAVTKKSSLGALSSVVLLPLLVVWLAPDQAWVALLLAVGVALRHGDNVRRLIAGTER